MENDAILLVGVLFFILICLVIRQVLQRMTLFKGAGSWIMAICITLLGIMGLGDFFDSTSAGTSSSENDKWLKILLLPYVVLILAIPLTYLIKFIIRLRGSNEKERASRIKRNEQKAQEAAEDKLSDYKMQNDQSFLKKINRNDHAADGSDEKKHYDIRA